MYLVKYDPNSILRLLNGSVVFRDEPIMTFISSMKWTRPDTLECPPNI